MSYKNNSYEANSTAHPPPPLPHQQQNVDAAGQAFPSGSKLAQYLHGAPRSDFSRPPPSLPPPQMGQMNHADMGAFVNYPMSQLHVSSGGAPPLPSSMSEMDGSEEDRVSAFLGNGDYANSRDYYPNHPAGDALSPSLDGYHSCTAYYAYQGLPSHIWTNRIKSQPVSPFFVNPALKAELVSRQLCLQGPSSSEEFPNVPPEAEQYFNLTPLNDASRDPKPNSTNTPAGMVRIGMGQPDNSVNTYRAIKNSDGLTYCLKRVSTQRPLSQKQLFSCENWKRLCHSNVVQLKEVVQTRAFQDNSFLFVYDFHPLAETLKTYHFGKGASEHHPLLPKHAAGPNFSGLPENLIWNYVIQLSSAIRYIHSCGLAIRSSLEVAKLLICGSKILINAGGMDDVMQGDFGRNIVAQQVDDLRTFGQLLIALTVGRLNATHQDQIASSMQYIDQHVTLDLKNAIHLLYGAKNIAGHKVTSINEIMPMVGARFYGQIENLQLKNDFLEDELSKEVENGRLFRLLCKLNTVNERPDLNMDAMWSETGDRYLLKLFRDYVFHQVTDSGKPWVDFSHVTSCLNKLDAGVEENIQLVSRNGDNILIVSFAELRKCLDNSWNSLSHYNSHNGSHSGKQFGSGSAVITTPTTPTPSDSSKLASTSEHT